MTGLIEQEPYLRIKKMFDEKKFDEIIVYCQKLLVKDPKNKIALQNISTTYNIVGGYNDAIQSSNKILCDNDLFISLIHPLQRIPSDILCH